MSEETKKAVENEEVETVEIVEETEKPVEVIEEQASEKEEVKEVSPAGDVPEPGAKAKPRTSLRFLLLIILLAVAWFAWKKHQRDAQFNKLIEMADSGKLADAAAGLRELMKTSSGQLKKRSKEELVRVILEQGDAPSNNVQESVVYYIQAYDIEPELLQMHHLQAIQNHLKKDPANAEKVAEVKKIIAKKAAEAAAALKAQRDAMTPEERKAEADEIAKAEGAVKAEVKKLPAKPAVKKLPAKPAVPGQ